MSALFVRPKRDPRAHSARPLRMLAFDVDATSVAVLAVESSVGSPPKIIFAERQDLPLRELFNPGRNIKDIFGRFDGLAHAAAHHVREGLDKIVFFVASPYVASQSRSVKVSFEQPQLVGEEFLSRLVHKEVEEFKKTQMSPYAGDSRAAGHELLESKIMGVRLNGYDTPHPVGKQANEVELSMFVSMIAADLARKLGDTARALFPRVPVELHSRSFALFHALRSLSVDTNYMIIDIRSEITDIAVVKHGVLIDALSHPSGESTIFRTVARKLNVPLALAPSSVGMLLHKTGHEAEHERLGSALVDARGLWLEGLGKMLAHVLDEYMLPSHMYVYASSFAGPFFKTFLADEALYHYGVIDSPLITTLVDDEFLGAHVQFPSHTKDPLLGSLAIALPGLCTGSLPCE